MRLQPRPYQIEAVQAFWNYFTEPPKTPGAARNPVIAMPTGTGKSVVIAMLLEWVFKAYPRTRVMMLTHVKELIEQNYEELMELWPTAPAGINSAGLDKRDYVQPIIFAGIASVAKYAHVFGYIDFIIIDEAHMVSPSDETMYAQFIAGLQLTNPKLRVVGLTATPWRSGQGEIIDGGIFTDFCFNITGMAEFNQLLKDGYLAPLIPKRPDLILNIDGVPTSAGDYNQKHLQNAVNKTEITATALREAMEVGHDRKRWLIFCAGVEHAIDTANMLTDFGIPCIAIHSKMGKEARKKAIQEIREGKWRAFTNNNVLTTGFNKPDIDLILCLRPTKSVNLWVQMLGRGTRPFEGKENCLVLDFANNTRSLGPINDPVVPRKKGKKGGTAPVKECPVCAAWNHATLRNCIDCGHEFTFQLNLKQGASTEELIKADLPVVKVFKVDHITYSKHDKVGRPSSLKVSYYCNLKIFTEYIPLEYGGGIGANARKWWAERWKEEIAYVPATTLDALMSAQKLLPATHLRVWVNKKYPEILKVCFDGSAFGDAALATTTVPTVSSSTPAASEEDIPF